MTSLREKYKKEVVPAMAKKFGYANAMAVPRTIKTVVNTGVGRMREDKQHEEVKKYLALITGQKSASRQAKKAIAAFKTRAGLVIGYQVTLRGERMYEFMDRLLTIALPRVRDFRGASRNSFDGRGSYTLGLSDQIVFPEIDYNKIDRLRGLQITVVTSARTDEEARRLLELLGMPFARVAERVARPA